MRNFPIFLAEQLLPQLPSELSSHFLDKYPNISLQPHPNFVPLPEVPVNMLVAFTGTGKTTTLDALEKLRNHGKINYAEDIPTRRELADWLVLPSSQVLLGEPIQPVKERTKRFQYTRHFSQIFPGSLALVYASLYYHWDSKTPLLSDGIRGAEELIYALNHCPNWRIIELWVDLATRLKRLSNRDDKFDRVKATAQLSLLPEDRQNEIHNLLETGQITSDAISIVQAESVNYGIEPFQPPEPTNHYHQLIIDDLSPEEVARKILLLMQNE